jgi:hypothetical protein
MSNKFINPVNPALADSSPKTGSFAFCQQTALSMKQADLRNTFRRASKYAYS